MKPWFLKFHRWIALAFAVPLLVVLGTGLILSFEPWLVTRNVESGAIDTAKIQTLLAVHDPGGKARGITYRSYDRTLTIGGGRGAGAGVVVEVASGNVLPGPTPLAQFLGTTRRLHETLLLEAGWLVTASSVVMLLLALLGSLMGLPRVEQTLSGWHKMVAWGLLPLIVLSPLTGLFMSMRVTFAAPPAAAAPAGPPLKLADAVDVVGKAHGLSGLVWLRPQGGRTLARLVENGEYRVYSVTGEGLTAMPRNWPRLLHEGNFAGAWSALMNVVTSVAMIALLLTGAWLWLRRTLRRRARRRQVSG